MSEQITIDDFAKLKLVVGIVKTAERIEGTRLLKLMIDIGTETRQVISGIAELYSAEEMVGKKVVLIANLKPRVIRGLESQGMILAAGCKEDEEKGIKPRLLTVDGGDIPPGTSVC